MGNRAIIKPVDMNIGLYLHWNGGRDSVEVFLKYCEMKGYRGLGSDTSYGLARLCQVISNYFGGSTSIGIIECDGTKKDACHIDNGIYVVKDWQIVDRVWYNGKASDGVRHSEQHNHGLQDMLEAIDKEQPQNEQFGVDYLRAAVVSCSSLEVGDVVYVKDHLDGRIESQKVIGIGEDRFVNGTNVKGIPYIGKYGSNSMEYQDNINNYLRSETIRLCGKGES